MHGYASVSLASSPRGNSLGALLGKQLLSCGVVGNTSDFGSEALGSNPGSSTMGVRSSASLDLAIPSGRPCDAK